LNVEQTHTQQRIDLADSSMPPIDQNTMRFYNRIAVDDGFDGLGLGEEAERLNGTGPTSAWCLWATTG